jgi:hypothetical protein
MATKYKNPPIWAKFGFQVDYDVVSMATAGILKFPSLKTIYTHPKQHFY